MPWRMCSMSAQRLEFVRAATQPDANISALCRAYGISRKTGYKWLERWRQDRDDRLEDRSRRPDHQPRRSDAQLEAAVVANCADGCNVRG
jgi:transposase-like protein